MALIDDLIIGGIERESANCPDGNLNPGMRFDLDFVNGDILTG